MARAIEGPMQMFGPEQRKQLQVAHRVGAVGTEMAVAVLIGYFGGHWMDGRLGTSPWLSYVGLVLGFAAGVKSLYVFARKMEARG